MLEHLNVTASVRSDRVFLLQNLQSLPTCQTNTPHYYAIVTLNAFKVHDKGTRKMWIYIILVPLL